jgi:hypothetical protein
MMIENDFVVDFATVIDLVKINGKNARSGLVVGASAIAREFFCSNSRLGGASGITSLGLFALSGMIEFRRLRVVGSLVVKRVAGIGIVTTFPIVVSAFAASKIGREAGASRKKNYEYVQRSKKPEIFQFHDSPIFRENHTQRLSSKAQIALLDIGQFPLPIRCAALPKGSRPFLESAPLASTWILHGPQRVPDFNQLPSQHPLTCSIFAIAPIAVAFRVFDQTCVACG